MQTNLSGLGEAMGFSRQHANKLSKKPGFPYLRKPGEQGATRWLVDVIQVRRWLEERDAESDQEARDRLENGRIEQAYRDFWRKALGRGYRPDEIASVRNRCFGLGDLKRQAKRWRIELDVR